MRLEEAGFGDAGFGEDVFEGASFEDAAFAGTRLDGARVRGEGAGGMERADGWAGAASLVRDFPFDGGKGGSIFFMPLFQ